MNLLTPFIVLIERRRLRRASVAVLSCLALLLTGPGMMSAQAAPAGGHKPSKLARDLEDEVAQAGAPKAKWARDLNGVRHVQAIVVTDTSDPQMTDLRKAVLGLGGSVHAMHPAVHAMTVQLPASQLATLALRSDVLSVSPNRVTQRTASTLEAITGALASNVRPTSTKTSYTGLDGSGIGIAVLDSGVMKAHDTFLNSNLTATRVKRNVTMLNSTLANWSTGVSGGSSLQPGSAALSTYEAAIAADAVIAPDKYGHGTHVASVAAGFAKNYVAGTPDTTGIAPNANIYDVKVLSDLGVGSVSDALEGIQWVIYHAKEYNIRVLNLSLAAASTQSWQTDPLCVAVRSASAAGITVVVAAGNFGIGLTGKETYGAISAPGNDPTVITVGAVNHHGTAARGDDTVNNFSSRGPTRGASVDSTGVRVIDNLLKPDLVAPGNKIVSAAASSDPDKIKWNWLATTFMGTLVTPLGITQQNQETQMLMSGTSISAPVVSGAVALMLQANPGLTPPLVKAILQYTAQPLAGYNLLQQGAGLLNIDGAVAIAKVLRTDLAGAIGAGTIGAGSSMLASGKSMPAATSTIGGSTFSWSRTVFAGGNHLVSGTALFTQYQPLWDPRITWANGIVRKRQPLYWSGTGIAANTFPQSFTDSAAPNQTLLTAGVFSVDSLVGSSSSIGKTGAFIPNTTLSAWLASGSGTMLTQGIVLSEGLVLSERVVLSEGIVLSEGLILSERVVLSEGLVLSEGTVLSEGLVLGEP